MKNYFILIILLFLFLNINLNSSKQFIIDFDSTQNYFNYSCGGSIDGSSANYPPCKSIGDARIRIDQISYYDDSSYYDESSYYDDDAKLEVLIIYPNNNRIIEDYNFFGIFHRYISNFDIKVVNRNLKISNSQMTIYSKNESATFIGFDNGKVSLSLSGINFIGFASIVTPRMDVNLTLGFSNCRFQYVENIYPDGYGNKFVNDASFDICSFSNNKQGTYNFFSSTYTLTISNSNLSFRNVSILFSYIDTLIISNSQITVYNGSYDGSILKFNSVQSINLMNTVFTDSEKEINQTAPTDQTDVGKLIFLKGYVQDLTISTCTFNLYSLPPNSECLIMGWVYSSPSFSFIDSTFQGLDDQSINQFLYIVPYELLNYIPFSTINFKNVFLKNIKNNYIISTITPFNFQRDSIITRGGSFNSFIVKVLNTGQEIDVTPPEEPEEPKKPLWIIAVVIPVVVVVTTTLLIIVFIKKRNRKNNIIYSNNETGNDLPNNKKNVNLNVMFSDNVAEDNLHEDN